MNAMDLFAGFAREGVPVNETAQRRAAQSHGCFHDFHCYLCWILSVGLVGRNGGFHSRSISRQVMFRQSRAACRRAD
ncbi:hypothetical protein [Burkholderia plantarii]|uniref:hypothetical protein n=1 Tax=Burkholderia plantarii TaxID=41899 RepID=UPI00114CB123|nr:hypothetical protein [Burkholderia plantarii]